MSQWDTEQWSESGSPPLTLLHSTPSGSLVDWGRMEWRDWLYTVVLMCSVSLSTPLFSQTDSLIGSGTLNITVKYKHDSKYKQSKLYSISMLIQVGRHGKKVACWCTDTTVWCISYNGCPTRCTTCSCTRKLLYQWGEYSWTWSMTMWIKRFANVLTLLEIYLGG